jgi:cyclohexanone monooxygenase
VSANTTAMFEQQGVHIAHVIKETLARGAAVVEPSRQAQDEWVRVIRETSITDRKFWRECTPGYYNNEGEEVFRSHLGEPYGPGFQQAAEKVSATCSSLLSLPQGEKIKERSKL